MHAAAIHSPTLRPSPLDPLRKHSPIPTLLTKPRKLSIAATSSLTTSAPKREKDPKKRGVITGTGLVSVFENDVDTNYLLLAGESGVGLIDRFDASKFPTQFAGQIHGFSSEGYIDGKNDRRLDNCLQYSIVAGKKALEHADLGGDKCSKNCNLSNGAIPDDIGSLSSLETLDLNESSFVELPSSICQLSQLTTFFLVGCKLIQALPELPSSIETILADERKSLKRLSNASTIFNSKNVYFGFANCLKILKKHSSLSDAIELFQHQALLGNSETICLCLPGNDIPSPRWFTYQNEGSSIGLQLHSNWYNSKLRGLAFCVVAGHTKETFFFFMPGPLEFVFSCNDSPMEIQIPYTVYRGRPRGTHVVLGYISRAWVRENEKGIMKALFEFKSEGLRVMKCGIHLVYGDDDVDDEKENAKFFKKRHQHHGESSKVLGLEEPCHSFYYCDPSLLGFSSGSESSGNDFSDGDHPSKRPRTFDFLKSWT